MGRRGGRLRSRRLGRHRGDQRLGRRPEFVGEASYLFRNNGDMTFSTKSRAGRVSTTRGRAADCLLLDYDRDGDMDIMVTVVRRTGQALPQRPVGTEHQLDRDPPRHQHGDFRPGTGRLRIAGSSCHRRGRDAVRLDGRRGDLPGAKRVRLALRPRFGHDGRHHGRVVGRDVHGADRRIAANQERRRSGRVFRERPGEASSHSDPAEQMLAAYNATTGQIDVSYTGVVQCHEPYDLLRKSVRRFDLRILGNSLLPGLLTGTTSFDPAGGERRVLRDRGQHGNGGRLLRSRRNGDGETGGHRNVGL